MKEPSEQLAEEAQKAIDSAFDSLAAQVVTVEQAFALIRERIPTPLRAALLSLETVLGTSLNLSAWQFHVQKRHDRAAEVLEIARRLQRGVTSKLGERNDLAAT